MAVTLNRISLTGSTDYETEELVEETNLKEDVDPHNVENAGFVQNTGNIVDQNGVVRGRVNPEDGEVELYVEQETSMGQAPNEALSSHAYEQNIPMAGSMEEAQMTAIGYINENGELVELPSNVVVLTSARGPSPSPEFGIISAPERGLSKEQEEALDRLNDFSLQIQHGIELGPATETLGNGEAMVYDGETMSYEGPTRTRRR